MTENPRNESAPEFYDSEEQSVNREAFRIISWASSVSEIFDDANAEISAEQNCRKNDRTVQPLQRFDGV